MNKTQKIIILITLAIVLLSALFPPYIEKRDYNRGDKVIKNFVFSTGWDWIFNLEAYQEERKVESTYTSTTYIYTHHYKIRFDILVRELIGIGIFGAILFVAAKRKKNYISKSQKRLEAGDSES